MVAMKQYEIEEVLQHLESAQYIGANKAISLIHKLNQRRLALQQRVWDLEQKVEEDSVVTRWEFVDGKMEKTK
jgi:hypothetical protein